AVGGGDVVGVKGWVNEAGTPWGGAGVRGDAESIVSGGMVHTSSASLVFAALDERGKPRRVPPVEPTTEVERQRQVEAKLRRENRLARAAAIRAARVPGELEATRADHGLE